MTLIAGIYAPNGGIESELRSEVAASISRSPEHRFFEFNDEALSLCHVDVGAYGDTGVWVDPSRTGLSCITGDPLLRGMAIRSRSADLKLLRRDWLSGDTNALKSATGVFSAVHYDAAEHRVTLLTDKLGVRPIYYWRGPRMTVFASALRILEQLSFVHREVDMTGVAELIGMSFPLDRRTAYSGIHRLQPAQLININRNQLESATYHTWTVGNLPGDRGNAKAAHAAFKDAVRRNLGEDRTVVSYLSGGLDSRCIVAELKVDAVETRTVTFFVGETQDRRFASAFSQAAGTVHYEREGNDLRGAAAKWSHAMRRVLDSIPSLADSDRPNLVWSGDGGSVGLGSVYLTPEVVRELNENKLEGAVQAFMRQQGIGLSLGVLRRHVRRCLEGVLARNIRDSVVANLSHDAVGGFHLFLMFNDQRHHLDQHFEEIDLHAVEFRLPFFDSQFIEAVLRVNPHDRLYHKFYHELLNYLPACAVAVPWQAYPGHQPCPVPALPGPAPVYQWSRTFRSYFRRTRRASMLNDLQWTLRSPAFPKHIISAARLRLAGLLYRAGLRDYSHVIVTARTITRYAEFASPPAVSIIGTSRPV